MTALVQLVVFGDFLMHVQTTKARYIFRIGLVKGMKTCFKLPRSLDMLSHFRLQPFFAVCEHISVVLVEILNANESTDSLTFCKTHTNSYLCYDLCVMYVISLTRYNVWKIR